jgi:hypothetical protein
VPGRADGRKKYQEERFDLGVYLLALATTDVLTYPFCPTVQGGGIARFHVQVEIGRNNRSRSTRATEQWFERAMTRADRETRNGQQGQH